MSEQSGKKIKMKNGERWLSHHLSFPHGDKSLDKLTNTEFEEILAILRMGKKKRKEKLNNSRNKSIDEEKNEFPEKKLGNSTAISPPSSSQPISTFSQPIFSNNEINSVANSEASSVITAEPIIKPDHKSKVDLDIRVGEKKRKKKKKSNADPKNELKKINSESSPAIYPSTSSFSSPSSQSNSAFSQSIFLNSEVKSKALAEVSPEIIIQPTAELAQQLGADQVIAELKSEILKIRKKIITNKSHAVWVILEFLTGAQQLPYGLTLKDYVDHLGADINGMDEQGFLPVSYALASFHSGFINLSFLHQVLNLIRFDLVDKTNKTPLQLAIALGIDRETVKSFGRFMIKPAPEAKLRSKLYQEPHNETAFCPVTKLTNAIENQDTQAIEELIAARIDFKRHPFNSTTLLKLTILHYKNHNRTPSGLDFLKLLLNLGIFDPAKEGLIGGSALDTAKRMKLPEVETLFKEYLIATWEKETKYDPLIRKLFSAPAPCINEMTQPYAHEAYTDLIVTAPMLLQTVGFFNQPERKNNLPYVTNPTSTPTEELPGNITPKNPPGG